MAIRKHKSQIPEEVLDYCIDEKLTVTEGLVAFLEDKFAVVDSTLRELKREVSGSIAQVPVEEVDKVTNEDMDDIDSFLRFLDQQMPEDPTDK